MARSLDGYDSLSRGVLFNLDYAITDRFSFSIGVPYLGSKYTGPEPSFFGLAVDDCFCWKHGWQDFGATARYNVVNGAFAFTPVDILWCARRTTTTTSVRRCSGAT